MLVGNLFKFNLKENVHMELKGSKTEEYLRKAYAREQEAYFYYQFAAQTASAAGLDLIADVFLQTANNEAEHAEHEFNFLGGVEDVASSLKEAIRQEEEATAFYREAAGVAEEEGFPEVAEFFRRIEKVEQIHKERFQQAWESVKQQRPLEGRTVRHSALTMAQLMLPAQANPAGFVHGGELMKLMDNAAGVVAARHSHSYVVTAQVNEIQFLHPVRVGSLVLVHAAVTFVSRSSMEVRIEVETEDLDSEKRIKALTAYYTMVAVDHQGKPQPVPPLIIYTEEEERRFQEGLRRYKERKERAAATGS